MRRPWGLFIFILLLAVGAGYIAWPNTPVNFKVGNFAVNLPAGSPLELKQGLDLQGGTSVTLKADMSQVNPSDRDQFLASDVEVIRHRVDAFGVSEPQIIPNTGNGEYRIVVELPGVKDVNTAVSLIGSTALLEMRKMTSKSQVLPNGDIPYDTTQDVGLTGKDLVNSTVLTGAANCNNSGTFCVQITFNDDGKSKFANLTGDASTQSYPLNLAPIYLDKQLLSSPSVEKRIDSNDAIITNSSFTADSAKSLSDLLRAGALKAPVNIIQQRTIGATIGDTAAKRSLLAGILGLIVIAIFMIGLYRKLGVVATVALLIYTLIVLAIFKLSTVTPYGVTLTLAGIAGFILSVGMAVDANILIFERMREELRRGKPRDVSLELGFARAWTSIRDSNITTMVVALIIYQFTSSFVRGFALTLLIGVAISMFTAIVVTRTLLRVFSKY